LERLLKSETALLEKANVLIHLSVDDFKLFQATLPSKPQFLAFPTIDEKFSSTVNAAAPPAESIDLLFVGQWHPPNLAAVKWFFEQVWPLIVGRQYKLKIVGPIGSLVQRELPQLYDTFRSCFTGEVADLIPYYRAARCVIAPMVSGSGTSIKTIEALALGKPFVGTSKAFRGMPMERLKEVGIQAHDEPQAFADAIVHALCSEREAQALSRAAYDKVFSVRASFDSRDEALRAATASRQRVPLLRRLRLL
jgi:glycosyltransferase involved in cell wall biosynthesis